LPTLCLIVAAARNGVIGRGGGLPWRIPSDLRTFRRLTLGKPVIMGRRTFQSIGRPLDGRDNIVVTRDPAFSAPGVEAVRALPAAIAIAERHAARRGAEEIMVIGGAEIYAEALPLADRIYLTEVQGEPEGETTFPHLDPAAWQEVRREALPPDPRDEYDCVLRIMERRRSPT
jgi:dihydrofolate reductase